MKKTCITDEFMPQWIVVGLGNPGPEHKYNRHNAGFLCIDILANKQNIKMDKLKHHALIGFGEIVGQRYVLMRPNTYMNDYELDAMGEAFEKACQAVELIVRGQINEAMSRL